MSEAQTAAVGTRSAGPAVPVAVPDGHGPAPDGGRGPGGAAVGRSAEEAALDEICRDITAHENAGDAAAVGYFRAMLAPDMRFRRANGETVGRDEFLASLAQNAAAAVRTPVGPAEIRVHESLAVASVAIETRDKANGDSKLYRNIRVFERSGCGWVLRMWINARVG